MYEDQLGVVSGVAESQKVELEDPTSFAGRIH